MGGVESDSQYTSGLGIAGIGSSLTSASHSDPYHVGFGIDAVFCPPPRHSASSPATERAMTDVADVAALLAGVALRLSLTEVAVPSSLSAGVIGLLPLGPLACDSADSRDKNTDTLGNPAFILALSSIIRDWGMTAWLEFPLRMGNWCIPPAWNLCNGEPGDIVEAPATLVAAVVGRLPLVPGGSADIAGDRSCLS